MKVAARAALALLPLLAACAATVAGCVLLYHYDNKYTAPEPAFDSGVVLIDGQMLAEHPVIELVDGWEVYGGRLLSPDDFAASTRSGNPLKPDKTVFIGQYGGFESFTPNGSPHGSATYRLVLKLPDAPRSYTLELPEIFSAYRAYVNGALVAQEGDPDPASYQPATLDTTVTFEAGGTTEIVVAVSDFSHFYSGMVYPPAFGLPNAVAQMLSARFLFRALLGAAALTIGLLAVLVGFLGRRIKPALLYGLVCLCFTGYIGYPLVKTFFAGYYPFYALENLAYCAMLVAIGLLMQNMGAVKGRRALIFPLFGAAVCAVTVVLHLMLAGQGQNLLTIMYGYSQLISAYEWLTALYLTFLAVYTVWKRIAHARPILLGTVVLDTALVMDRLLPLHEPIVTGWFPELASFVLIACIGVAVGAEVARQYLNSAVQSERAQSMERLLQQQQSYYAVLDEKMEDTRALRHDLRHHIAVLDGLIAGGQYEELGKYLSGFKQDIEAAAPQEYSHNRVINVLANHYSSLAARQGIRFDLKSDLPGSVSMSDADLSALFCNLLENALEACIAFEGGERFIRGAVVLTGNTLHIRIVNSARAGLKPQGDNRFASSKAEGRTGYGLYSIRMITKKYAGQSNTEWDESTQVFTHRVTLFLP